MLTFISKLQRKPEHIRKKIAVVTSAAMTGIIVILWLVSMSSSFERPASDAVRNEDEVGPFQTLTEGFRGLFADTKTALQAATGAFSGLLNEGNVPLGEETVKPAAK